MKVRIAIKSKQIKQSRLKHYLTINIKRIFVETL